LRRDLPTQPPARPLRPASERRRCTYLPRRGASDWSDRGPRTAHPSVPPCGGRSIPLGAECGVPPSVPDCTNAPCTALYGGRFIPLCAECPLLYRSVGSAPFSTARCGVPPSVPLGAECPLLYRSVRSAPFYTALCGVPPSVPLCAECPLLYRVPPSVPLCAELYNALCVCGVPPSARRFAGCAARGIRLVKSWVPRLCGRGLFNRSWHALRGSLQGPLPF
jgi:hypothetical protein